MNVEWIDNILNKNIEKKLEKINKDFYELGKEFKELKDKGVLNYEEIEKKFLLKKSTVNKYIEISNFIDKHELTNYAKIGIKRLELLQKIDDATIIKKIAKNIDNYTIEDIKKFIKDYKNRRVIKKCFNLTELDNDRFEQIKKYIEKELDTKLTNSQVFSYIIDYFYINEKIEN